MSRNGSELPHPFVARVLLSCIATTQGVAAVKMDLNRSHATNPLWLPHARFHLVWQVLNLALLTVAELSLILWPGPGAGGRFYLAGCLIAMTLVAFWGALASIRRYAGALFDQNGVGPLEVSLRGKIFQLEMNLVAVILGSIVLVVSVSIYR